MEMLLGRVAPQVLPSNETVIKRGLADINSYRTANGYKPITELPRALTGCGYDHCVLGRAVADMPNSAAHAQHLSNYYRGARDLEIRFEREQIPQLITHPSAIVETYTDAHHQELMR